MPVLVYKSTDAGAPVLTGLAGSLVTVLDAVLTTGYGAKAAAGWAIAFTGANKRIYRPPTGQLRGFYRVQDDAPNPTFAGGREARVKGSEAATGVDVQTNLFPTAAQLANGLFVRKSATADATAVPWIAIADDRTLYFFNNTKDYTGYSSFMIGEYFSLKPTPDAFNGMVIGRAIEQVAATPTANCIDERLDDLAAITAGLTGHYVPRSWTEFYPSAVQVGKHGNAAHSAITLCGLAAVSEPGRGWAVAASGARARAFVQPGQPRPAAWLLAPPAPGCRGDQRRRHLGGHGLAGRQELHGDQAHGRCAGDVRHGDVRHLGAELMDLGAIGIGAPPSNMPGAVPAGSVNRITAVSVSLPIMTWLGITTLPPGSPWTASAPGSQSFVSAVSAGAFVVPATTRVLGR
jgi:hypothetical protein